MWGSQVTSQVALNALYFVLTIKVYELTSSNTVVSILILTFTVPSIFLGYIAGVYIDQVNLKKALLVSNFIRAFSILALIFFINSTVVVFLLVLVLAIATLFFIPAEGSSIPALVEDSDLIAANSLFSISLQVGLIVGFLVGGFALNIFGESATLIAIFIFFLISLLLSILLPKNIKSEAKEQKIGLLKSFWEGIKFIATTKVVRDAIFFLTLTTTIFFVLATIGPGYVDKVLNLKVKYSSALVIAPAVAGMVAGAIVLSHIANRLTERALVNIGLFGMGVTFLALAAVGAKELGRFFQLFSLLCIFLLGVGNAFVNIPTTTAFQKNTPEKLRGRAYGLLGTFISGVAALPVILSGAVGDIFGVRSVLTILGVVVLSFGLYRLRVKTL